MRRRFITVAAPAVAVVAVATAAFGAWSGHSSSGAARTKALTVPQVTGMHATGGAGSASLTWTSVTAAAFGPGVTGYKVMRYTTATGNTGATAVCSGALTSTAASCTDSGVTAGTYFYGVSALYKPTGVSWTGVESTRASATVTAAGPTLTISWAAGSGHRSVFNGTTTIKTGTVTVKVYAGSTATGTAVQTYTTTTFTGTSSPFSWSITTGNADLTTGTQYTAQATQVDGSGNNSANQPTVTFTGT